MGSNPTRAIARTESEKKHMKYVDILELIKKEGGQPLPVWTTFAESESGYQNNSQYDLRRLCVDNRGRRNSQITI